MAWFEEGYQARANPMTSLAVSLYCEPIHKDPRFGDLLERMNLGQVKASYLRDQGSSR
jgi:hypothetical protein